jgi:hypothetical protein
VVQLINAISLVTGIIVLSLFLTGCPEEVPIHDFKMDIINSSTDGIVWYSYNSVFYDTSLLEEFPWYDIESSLISENSLTRQYLASHMIKGILDSGYIHYYLFNYNSIKNIPWERIRDEYIIAKRVDFDTWEELEAVDFKVTYP